MILCWTIHVRFVSKTSQVRLTFGIKLSSLPPNPDFCPIIWTVLHTYMRALGRNTHTHTHTHTHTRARARAQLGELQRKTLSQARAKRLARPNKEQRQMAYDRNCAPERFVACRRSVETPASKKSDQVPLHDNHKSVSKKCRVAALRCIVNS